MIKNVVIVGLGGVGAVYASKLPMAKILVTKERFERYKSSPTVINGLIHEFNYVTECPKNPDLIIITTKFYNLNEVLEQIKPTQNTIILSLINGVSAVEIISKKFPESIVVPAYLICDSIMRKNREVIHNDNNKIVMSSNKDLEEFFKENRVNFEVVKDIKTALWQKFMLNVVANQLSAVTKMTFGEMNSLPYIDKLLNNILREVVDISEREGVKNPKGLAQKTVETFHNMAPYGKTSMLQDIENGKKTEIDAFAGYLVSLGKKYGIKTPYSDLFYYLLNL